MQSKVNNVLKLYYCIQIFKYITPSRYSRPEGNILFHYGT
jgi:hypothetical protein